MASKQHKSPWTAEYKKYGEKTWICNSCNAKIRAADGNTSNLKDHVKNSLDFGFLALERKIEVYKFMKIMIWSSTFCVGSLYVTITVKNMGVFSTLRNTSIKSRITMLKQHYW